MLRRWYGLVLAAGLVLALLAPGQTPNNFRFCILGDRTTNAEPGVYDAVWREIVGEHPDFVINAGDTIQGGNDATAESEWQALRPLWKLPVYFTPGNHDIWSSRSREVYEKQTGHPAFYGFNYQAAHFTILDNSQTENLDERQMDFLASDLEKNKDRDPKFVLFHKPFWLIPVKFQSGTFPFHKLIQKYGVKYVISGHGHQYVCLSQDGITYIEAGSSGGQLKGKGFDQGWFFGHIEVLVKGARVEMTAHEIGAPLGQGRTFPFVAK